MTIAILPLHRQGRQKSSSILIIFNMGTDIATAVAAVAATPATEVSIAEQQTLIASILIISLLPSPPLTSTSHEGEEVGGYGRPGCVCAWSGGLDYVCWHREKHPETDTYAQLITLVCCHCIVHADFLAHNLNYELILFPDRELAVGLQEESDG